MNKGWVLTFIPNDSHINIDIFSGRGLDGWWGRVKRLLWVYDLIINAESSWCRVCILELSHNSVRLARWIYRLGEGLHESRLRMSLPSHRSRFGVLARWIIVTAGLWPPMGLNRIYIYIASILPSCWCVSLKFSGNDQRSLWYSTYIVTR